MAQHPAPDIATLTEAARALWSSGDFNQIARQTMMVAEDLCRVADPRPRERMLDIACGSGNVALIAARRFCDVAGIDLADNLIERARLRAVAEGLEAEFRQGDAQALPWADGSFDVVTSAFGIMFAPDQHRAASEALRVCRRGGRLVLANWMPEGFGQDFFGVHARHAPPPEGMPSPLNWGTEVGLRDLLGGGISDLRLERRSSNAYYRSLGHAVEVFTSYFGPTIRALSVVGPEGEAALREDLAGAIERCNIARDGTVAMETDYLLAVATRA
ncbi:class I SAM-dependent methyltransferase [Alkalilacustris brevis]|uniref:class I SAM-dependent methyltransferase n=1 Tax=Alkalilacustris brevis TaxID=2026338 RepID=UPI000E0D0856|nr:class I SAM-dependent methyltransferase [Alkalilacustris brevis]